MRVGRRRSEEGPECVPGRARRAGKGVWAERERERYKACRVDRRGRGQPCARCFVLRGGDLREAVGAAASVDKEERKRERERERERTPPPSGAAVGKENTRERREWKKGERVGRGGGH